MDSSSDGNRVCRPTTSAISWSQETVFSYLRALWASIFAPVSQVSAQTWAWPSPFGWCSPLNTVKSSRCFSSGLRDGDRSYPRPGLVTCHAIPLTPLGM